MFRGKSLIFLFQTAVSSAADHKRRQNELRTSLRRTVTQFSWPADTYVISVCRFSSSQNPLCQQTDFSKATQFHSNYIYQSYFIEHITPQNKTSAGAIKKFSPQ